MPTFKCPDCGTKVSTTATSCPKCGHVVTDADLPKKKEAPAQGDAKPKKKMALWKKGLIAVIVLCVIGAIFGEHNLTPEEKAQREQERAEKAKIKEEEKAKALAEKNAKLLQTATLKDYKKDNSKAWPLVFAYLTEQGIGEDEQAEISGGMVACLSTMAYTKQETLSAKEVLGWCNTNRTTNPKAYEKNVDLAPFFSKFDELGQWEPISLAIFNAMHDPMSYSHEGTWYSLHLDANPPYATIETKFRGKNAFGAKVLNTKKFKVDLKTLSWAEL